MVSKMPTSERIEITKAVANLYFGSDWRLGTVRMRRRIAFSNDTAAHQSGNEMTILRSLASKPNEYFGTSGIFSVALSYISQLRSKGFYGEAYEAAREFLGIASSEVCAVTDEETTHLQILAGQSARMIGEREACVEFLSDALPKVRESGQKELLTDVLVDLALVQKTLQRNGEAVEAAEEILENAPKNSSNYLQAKAVIAELQMRSTRTCQTAPVREARQKSTASYSRRQHHVRTRNGDGQYGRKVKASS